MKLQLSRDRWTLGCDTDVSMNRSDTGGTKDSLRQYSWRDFRQNLVHTQTRNVCF